MPKRRGILTIQSCNITPDMRALYDFVVVVVFIRDASSHSRTRIGMKLLFCITSDSYQEACAATNYTDHIANYTVAMA